MTEFCPFCQTDETRVFLRLPQVQALWDGFPVSEGHALIVPYRHIPTLFEARPDERAELFNSIELVCSHIRQKFGADGFNLGVNMGSAAGQTVPHLHLHVIPRRTGDVADPRGGVRHVIPGKGNYLTRDNQTPTQLQIELAPPSPHELPIQAWATHRAFSAFSNVGSSAVLEPRLEDVLLTTGEQNPLLPNLENDLAFATQVDIAVAFVMKSGIERLYPHFEDLLERGGSLRLITGDYLGITDPDGLERLLDLQTFHGEARCELRIYVSGGQSFHPKAYLTSRMGGGGVAYVGSSNLSGSALLDGVEWNYRVSSSRDFSGWQQVKDAFEALFLHPNAQALAHKWLSEYRVRRVQPQRITEQIPTDHPIDPPAISPAANQVQKEALQALEATRAMGNRAGLVVMATGLGKTWLAAFDTDRPLFRTILFVAHREEILNQALATFRRIRPTTSIGLFNGTLKAQGADILFASIQSLSRRQHLERFARDAFDYIVIDEFHHADAATYRRLINYFEPKFLLGLTATPERTDGGNLLGLCGENLVFRCGVPRGIELELLCPYDYFGVPDDVDYRNLPWRNNRFSEEELTTAVATETRANNVIEQWKKRGGERTIGFCVSRRHADYMRAWFTRHGVACASVHSGPSSDHRALSLERLNRGELRVVFAVDMFNEGVDVPAIDTVMMLRPTESAIVWLQQFGRGLRRHGTKRLRVIDYIGNHRSFLLKVRTLFELDRSSDSAIRTALELVQRDNMVLPAGCSVTYELEAVNILRALLRDGTSDSNALIEYYQDFRGRTGQRPSASETFHDGYLPRTARASHGSWFSLVRSMGDLDDLHIQALEASIALLSSLESTPMNKSYKMLLLQAMLNTDTLPGHEGIEIETLTTEFARVASRSARLRGDVGISLDDAVALRQVIRNPIKAWTGPGAVKDGIVFALEGSRLRFIPKIQDALREAFQSLVRELVDWRIAEYLARAESSASESDQGVEAFAMKVSHVGKKPMLFLPDRAKTKGVPTGWTPVLINGEDGQANFVKVAINVLRIGTSSSNQLQTVLRGWFGENAGHPGTDHRVRCRLSEVGWILEPFDRHV